MSILTAELVIRIMLWIVLAYIVETEVVTFNTRYLRLDICKLLFTLSKRLPSMSYFSQEVINSITYS